MRKTIVFNLLLILGYYFILQLLVWLAMIFRYRGSGEGKGFP